MILKHTGFSSLAVIVLLCVAGCRTGPDSSPQAAKYIPTVYGTTGNVPYEAAVTKLNVTVDLHHSAGRFISVIGARHDVKGQAAIWIPDSQKSVTIIVKDQKPWSGAPSHRSLIYITGLLTIEKGQVCLSRTTWEWIDS
jgi:hypothetical protein